VQTRFLLGNILHLVGDIAHLGGDISDGIQSGATENLDLQHGHVGPVDRKGTGGSFGLVPHGAEPVAADDLGASFGGICFFFPIFDHDIVQFEDDVCVDRFSFLDQLYLGQTRSAQDPYSHTSRRLRRRSVPHDRRRFEHVPAVSVLPKSPPVQIHRRFVLLKIQRHHLVPQRPGQEGIVIVGPHPQPPGIDPGQVGPVVLAPGGAVSLLQDAFEADLVDGMHAGGGHGDGAGPVFFVGAAVEEGEEAQGGGHADGFFFFFSWVGPQRLGVRR